MPNFARRSDRNERVALLVACAAASVLLWQTSWGSTLLYPFTILATWFHEMGHGLAALLTGNSFEELLIFADGSGLATSSRNADGYSLTSALISAGGPLGPALAGSGLILASRHRDSNPVRSPLARLRPAPLHSHLGKNDHWLARSSGRGRADPGGCLAGIGYSPAPGHPDPRCAGWHQRLAAVRLPLQRWRRDWWSADAIGHKRDRRCPLLSLLVLGRSAERPHRGDAVVEPWPCAPLDLGNARQRP